MWIRPGVTMLLNGTGEGRAGDAGSSSGILQVSESYLKSVRYLKSIQSHAAAQDSRVPSHLSCNLSILADVCLPLPPLSVTSGCLEGNHVSKVRLEVEFSSISPPLLPRLPVGVKSPCVGEGPRGRCSRAWVL